MNPNQSERDRLNDLSRRAIGCAIEVHRQLGPGLLESAYEEALACELTQGRIGFERQVHQPLVYKGVTLSSDYRLDFLVEGKLVLEIKTVAELLPIHDAQLLTYLKLRNGPLGLLINFNVTMLKDGIRRMVFGPLFREG